MAVISIETKDFVQTITMDRPDALNAFNKDMMHEICEAFLGAATDKTVRVLVLTGRGRAFTSGADLKSISTAPDPAKHDLRAMMNAIIDFPKPFLIAANGLGVGIGMTIHGVADMSFMATSARFRAPFSSLGLTAEAASTYTFSRLMGHQKASWALLSGEWFSAAECVEMGLAFAAIPDESLLDVVYEHAAKLAKLPPASVMKSKQLMLAPHRDAMHLAVLEEGKGLASLSGGAENKEAIKAFLAKREPDFSHL